MISSDNEHVNIMKRAISELGAVQVENRWAFFLEGRWRVAHSAALEKYAHEGNALVCVAMPKWWSPGNRFFYRAPKREGGFRYACRIQLPYPGANPAPYERITADLETGAEVRA